MPKHLKIDSVDCDELIYSMKKWHCLRNFSETDVDACYRCKFDALHERERRIRLETREHRV